MRCKLLYTILILLVLTSFSYAEKIKLKNNFFTGWKYSVDGGISYKKVGFTGGSLYETMEGNELAQYHMRKYKKNQIMSSIIGIPGIFLITSTIDGMVREWENKHTAYFITGVSFIVVASIYESTATNHLKKGVQIYNGDEQSISLKANFNLSKSVNSENIQISLVYAF